MTARPVRQRCSPGFLDPEHLFGRRVDDEQAVPGIDHDHPICHGFDHGIQFTFFLVQDRSRFRLPRSTPGS